MPRTTTIKPWLSLEDLRAWSLAPTARQEYQRRLAIWILASHPMPTHVVADLLGVSVQAIWKWVAEFNRLGPEGLERTGRGGRRQATLPLAAEKALAAKLHDLRQRFPKLSVRNLQPEINRVLGREVPLHYLYRLLRRWPQEE